MNRKKIFFLVFASLALPVSMLHAQEPLADSVKTGGLKKTMNNIFHVAVNAVTRAGTDSAREAAILNTKSELPFKPYQGKGIRHIFIHFTLVQISGTCSI